jgi:hypothetical protein
VGEGWLQMMTPQKRAAKTRAANLAGKRLYEEISRPAHEKVEKVLNRILLAHGIRLNWVGPWRLKNGVTGARLAKIYFGGLSFDVHIDGYKTVQRHSSQFWEVV